MLPRESENLRFNLVSSRPCQVSPAETGPKCPTVYLGVRRFGSHGSAPGWLPQHRVHSNGHQNTRLLPRAAPCPCKHLPSANTCPCKHLPSRPPGPLLPSPSIRDNHLGLQPLLSRALCHGGSEGMKWGGGKEAVGRLQGGWEGQVGPAASSYSQPGQSQHHLGCASSMD